MPFDGGESWSIKTVLMIDYMLEYFDEGRRWWRGALKGFQGEMCLLGAMNHFRKQERLKGDRTRLYLMRAIRQEGFKATGVMDFNDGPRRYSDITRVLRRARELVNNTDDRRAGKLTEPLLPALRE